MPNPRKSGASRKAAGNPKRRWTAAERAARGRAPRKDATRQDPSNPRRSQSTRDERGRYPDERADRRGPGRSRQDKPSRWTDRDQDRRGQGRERRTEQQDRRDKGPATQKFRRDQDWGRGPRQDRDRDWGPREDRREGGWGPDRRERDWSRSPREDRRDSDRGRHDDRRERDWSRSPREDRDREDRDREWSRALRGERDGATRGHGRREDRPRDAGRRTGPPHKKRRPGRDQDSHQGHAGRARRPARAPQRDRQREEWDRPWEETAQGDQMAWEQSASTAQQPATPVETDGSGFAELGVAAPLVQELTTQGITEPFPIQRATIADAVAGRDVLGRGRTGSGKTLAFGLPTLTRLADGDGHAPRALILTPTRELALQIADNLAPLAHAVGLRLQLVAGGMAYGPQIKAFQRGVDVVVATPGRLIDLLEQGAVDLSQVEVAVLDEADQMADMGFLPEVRTLLDATPGDGQRLLFSATLDDAVATVVREYLTDPVTHEVDPGQASVSTMTHLLLELAPHHKNQVTAEIANREGRTIVFARTQMGADRIAGQLRRAGVMAGALHGGLTQGARARVLEAFRRGDVPVLVATDVAARGIHVDDVSLVLQVDPPQGPKDYLHRAGRTARAGGEGTVVSLVLPHQRKQVRRLTGQAGVKATMQPTEPGSDALQTATGARPVSGEEVSDADYQALVAPAQPRRRPGRGGPQRERRARRRW